MRVLLRTAIVVMAAVGIFGVTAAQSSAAEPAFFECAKLKGGEFKDKLCSEPGAGKGKYELTEGVGANPELTGKISETLIAGESPDSGFEIGCEKSRVLSGRLASPTSFSGVMIQLANCDNGLLDCGATIGHHTHLIDIGPLAGPIGYISRGSHTVGVDLTPETGSTLAEFRCGGTGPPEYRFKGAIFGTLGGDINVFSKPFQIAVGGTLSFEGGEPNPLEVEEIATTQTEVVRLSGTPWKMKGKSLLEVKA
jgi:hypothetical protein